MVILERRYGPRRLRDDEDDDDDDEYFCGRLRKISQQILDINCHVQRENLVTFLDFRISQGSVAKYGM